MADHAALGAHQRVHSGARPYACSFPGCGATFAQKSNCTRHMRTHTGERPFVCTFPGCTSSFSQKSSLAYHLGVHTNNRPHRCEYVAGCTASFPSGTWVAGGIGVCACVCVWRWWWEGTVRQQWVWARDNLNLP